jgi:hypothetical protein
MPSNDPPGPNRRPARRVLLAVATAVALVAGPAAAAGAEPSPAAPQALFVQVGTLWPYSPAAVQWWIERTCQGREVVLQDVAGQDGRLIQPYLDVIAPYLPGGSRACFSRVFVGTVDLAWTGPGSTYTQGVQDAGFRTRYLTLSDAAARAFVARYPRLRINWYLTLEADLNQLYYPAVQQAYRSLLSTEMANLRAVRRAAVMWSPSFAYPYSAYRSNLPGITQLRANLVDLFATLARTAGGVQYLNLQDFVAGSACEPAWNRTTPSDAVGWVSFLVGLGQLPNVELNVEQYAFDCTAGGIGPGNATEIAARTDFYRATGVRLGPAFEIRYWMQINGMSLAAA